MHMKTNVIDPSEIIIENLSSKQKDTVYAYPWARLLARFTDYALFLLLLLGLSWVIHQGRMPKETVWSERGWIPLEFFGWIPIEAAFLYFWGKTPGKAFLKVYLRQGKRFKFEFRTALRRSFNVWFRGLGMMIPFVNLVCLTMAYYRLKTAKHVSWDHEEQMVVSHGIVGRWRCILASLWVLTIFGLYYLYRS